MNFTKVELPIHILIGHLYVCLWILCSYLFIFPFWCITCPIFLSILFILVMNKSLNLCYSLLCLIKILPIFMLVRLNIHKYFPCLCFTFNFLNLLNINYLFKYFYFFNIYLFDCTRSWLQHVVSWPGNKCGPSTLGTWSLSHWSTKEVPHMFLIFIVTFIFFYLAALGLSCGMWI